jgi:hypothetical protein
VDPPQFYFRPEHDEWDFVRERGGVADAILIPARYCAPYPEGHPSHGQEADRLVQAGAEANRPAYYDPGTAGLVSKSVTRHGAGRLRQTPAAQAVELPLDIAALRDSGRRNALVDVCLEGQAGSPRQAAPYLDYRNIRDERFGLNVQMLERVVSSVGPDRAMGFLQVTWTRLMNGELMASVPRVAATGVKLIFVRIRGLDAERATGEELSAYATVVADLTRRDVAPVPDCVGRLGPPLMTIGANAFSGGAHNFRRVGQALLSLGGGGGGVPLSYELSTGGEMPRSVVSTAKDASPGSSAGESPLNLDDLRERRLRIWRDQAREAASAPMAFLERLGREGDQTARVWSSTLLRRRRKAA